MMFERLSRKRDQPAQDGAPAEDDRTDTASDGAAAGPGRRFGWRRAVVYGLLPAVAFLLAGAAGYFKWEQAQNGDDALRSASVQAAKDSTIALLTYQPAEVEQQLSAARGLLTGDFLDAYTQLTTDVVIPGAKEKQISATATVPAAASVSVSADRAVVIVFVNQQTAVGSEPPTDTTSSIRVGLEQVDGRWLISQFDPV